MRAYPVRLRSLRPIVILLAALALAVEVAWLVTAGVCWFVFRPTSVRAGPETTSW
jgi:hypothetical protein